MSNPGPHQPSHSFKTSRFHPRKQQHLDTARLESWKKTYTEEEMELSESAGFSLGFEQAEDVIDLDCLLVSLRPPDPAFRRDWSSRFNPTYLDP